MQRGELVQWNDVRGFGFIEAEDGIRYFVHISSVSRIATRPREGDLVSFTPGQVNAGRPQAQSVSILGANPIPTVDQRRGGTRAPVQITWRLPLAGLLAALIFIGLLLDKLPLLLGGFYLLMGTASCVAYGSDKRFAENGQWRISEATLLGVDLCFGVIGGLIGQEAFRHKTQKPDFVACTLAIAGAHLVGIAGMVFGILHSDALDGFIAFLDSAQL